MFMANFNTRAKIHFASSNKRACIHTFQKLEACPDTKHLEITDASAFSEKTTYNSALHRGVVFAMQFPNRQLG
jgi:hypothetical protein